MNVIDKEQLLEQLQWRYATKMFDPVKKIPEDMWQVLENSLVLTPSSYGLQPWKFYVITDKELRESLVPHTWNQRQVADCSHLVVIAVNLKMTVADVNKLLDRVVEVRGGDRAALDGFGKMMISDIVEGPRSQDATQWAKLQAYIALGNFMTSAALLGVDTCPMEGFMPPEYDKALGLEEKGLTTAVLCPAGYRLQDDKYAQLAKVRYSKDSVIVNYP